MVWEGPTWDALLLDDVRAIATSLEDEDGLVGPLGKARAGNKTANTATDDDKVKALVGEAGGVVGDRALHEAAVGVVHVVTGSHVRRGRRDERG